jgi:eukaryotic-like serine/threonine-protein kinase
MDRNLSPVTHLPEHYQVAHSLGKGQFGEVFYAEDTRYRPPRKVAIKVFNTNFIVDAGTRRDIHKEASTLARFKHPHILGILDFGINEHLAFIVTDLAEGGSLEKKIRPDPNKPSAGLSIEQVLIYLEQIAEAIDEAHAKNIIHRDIKLHNILLDHNGMILLADFGLAAVLHTSQTSGMINIETGGTPHYIAPEHWFGSAGKLSDIYSLGVVIYILLTGEPPFQGGPIELMTQHLHRPVPKLSEKAPDLKYPPMLDRLIAFAMAKDPKQRVRSARELSRLFKAILKHEAVNIPTPQPLTQVIGYPITEDDFQKRDEPKERPETKKTPPPLPWKKNPRPLKLARPLRNFITLPGHFHPVNALAFSPVDQLLASAGVDATIRIWDIPTKQPVRTLADHQRDVQTIAFSPDGKLIASAGFDGTIKLWEVATGHLLHTFHGHNEAIWSLVFSPNGSLVASVGDDKLLRFSDVKNHKSYPKKSPHKTQITAVAFSPDGSFLATGAWDRTILLWDFSTGKPITRLEDPYSMINTLAFSPDGKLLASGTHDGKVKIWDIGKEDLILTITEHINAIKSIVFNPDGQILYSAGADKVIKLWKFSGQPINNYTGSREFGTFTDHRDSTNALAISPNGELLASAGEEGKIQLWVLAE